MSTKAIQTAYFATGASQVVEWVKNSPTMQETQETQVQSLGQEDPLQKETATHSSILVQKMLQTEEPGGQSGTQHSD